MSADGARGPLPTGPLLSPAVVPGRVPGIDADPPARGAGEGSRPVLGEGRIKPGDGTGFRWRNQ